jgi:hypothetical protein
MSSFVQHFQDGGCGMFPTLVFGAAMLAVALKYALRPEGRILPLLIGLGVLTFSAGALGFVTGMIVTCGAIERAPQQNEVTLALLGFGESLNNVAFALIFVVLAAMAASFGAWRLSKLAPGTRPSLSR